MDSGDNFNIRESMYSTSPRSKGSSPRLRTVQDSIPSPKVDPNGGPASRGAAEGQTFGSAKIRPDSPKEA